MTTYRLSDNTRLEKSTIDKRVSKAKESFIQDCMDEGKLYCWACGTTRERLSCSHIISVNNCQQDGLTDEAWNIDNLQLECLKCHDETERRNYEHHANARYKKNYTKYYKELKEDNG